MSRYLGLSVYSCIFRFYSMGVESRIAWVCSATAEHVEVSWKINPKLQIVNWSEMQATSFLFQMYFSTTLSLYTLEIQNEKLHLYFILQLTYL